MRQRKLIGMLCILGTLLVSPAVIASISVGDIASDFTLVNHKTGEDVSLYDFEGGIVLIEFFGYHCPHCRTASSELEPEVQEHYDQLGGNPDGIPVTLLSISTNNSILSRVTDYQNTYHLDIVLRDTSSLSTFYNYYDSGTGIPQLLLLNGANSSNYDKWEVVYKLSGYGEGYYNVFRSYIDAVEATPPIPGDANGDGKVDGSDVTILADNWQRGVPYGDPTVTWEMGDFNGNHMIDGSDVTILADNWQYGVTTAAAAVPEPSTIILLTLGLGMLLVSRLSKRHY